MSVLTATTLISTQGTCWNYPGCWHQMYPNINRSIWPKYWPNVKVMSCSVTLGHQMPLLGSTGGVSMSDDRPAWPTGWLNSKLTWDAFTWGYIWLKSMWPQVYVTSVVTHMAFTIVWGRVDGNLIGMNLKLLFSGGGWSATWSAWALSRNLS